jgi:hypothetical protein
MWLKSVEKQKVSEKTSDTRWGMVVTKQGSDRRKNARNVFNRNTGFGNPVDHGQLH